EMALLQSPVRILLRPPGAPIPDQDRAAAILALGDGAFEAVVFDRVILDLHRQPFFAWNEAGPARHRPALHDAVELEPQVVMQPRRRVLLDNEMATLDARLAPARLGRHAELPFLTVDVESHSLAV